MLAVSEIAREITFEFADKVVSAEVGTAVTFKFEDDKSDNALASLVYCAAVNVNGLLESDCVMALIFAYPLCKESKLLLKLAAVSAIAMELTLVLVESVET